MQKQKGIAIVTGATGGMGSASARRLASDGWDLILTDIDEGRLGDVAASISGHRGTIEVLASNIVDAQFLSRLLSILGERLVGALVHSAGVSPTMGDADLMFSVNFDATARLLQALLPRMAEGSCAVLIASSSGYSAASPQVDALIATIPLGGDSSPLRSLAKNSGHAYSLSKRGVQLMAAQQATAFGLRQARVVSISPGLIDTAMGRAEQDEHPVMAEMLKRTPLRRYGSADEIASVAAFLCSSDASYISGSDIKVDGGVLAVL